MQLPNIRSYGNYSSDNYGVNSLEVTIGDLTLWFSYQTVVAFEDGFDFHIRENVWGSTTGKHLNWIDPDKSKREDSATFEVNLEKALKKHNLIK